MTQAEKNLHDAVATLVDENPKLALSVLTAHFVGLTVAMIKAQGYPDDRDILIDSDGSRDITIHKKKETEL